MLKETKSGLSCVLTVSFIKRVSAVQLIVGLYLFFLPGYKRGPWSLVCETEEQWVSLAESIKDKTSPQDRHLYRVITQNFLPEISSMIEHKVRSLEEP